MVFAAVLSLSGCGGEELWQKTNVGERVNWTAPKGETALHTVATDVQLEKVAASGLVELFYDHVTSAICVKETTKNKNWYSLPAYDAKNEQQTAAMVSVRAWVGETVYTLNSQDHSVAFGTNTYTIENGVLTLTYLLFADAETAKKETYGAADAAFSVTLQISLKDGSLYASATHKTLTNNPEAFIEELSFLQYFGAYTNSAEIDMLLVPDGCGALVKTGVADADFRPLSLRVYGADTVCGEDSTTPSAVLPAYGMLQGASGFVTLIEAGDALATISCDRVRTENVLNFVGASFTVTPVKEDNGLYRAQNTYTEDLRLCMRFSTSSDALYSTLAAAVREQLIRNKVLSTRSVEVEEYLPMNVTLAATMRVNVFSLRRWALVRNKTTTTFSQAQTIVEQLKSKSVNNINLQITGAFSGGSESVNAASASLLRRLGGESGYTQLQSYMNTQNMTTYLDFDLLQKGGGLRNNAVDITGVTAVREAQTQTNRQLGVRAKKNNLRALSNLDYTVNRVLAGSRNTNPAGLSVSDAGALLYADYSAAGANRQTAAQLVAQALSQLSTNRKLLVGTGNVNMLKSAAVVLHMPMEPSREETEAYEAIPFLQQVLHGVVDYSGEPINFYTDPADAMLQYIEYGACPYFSWTYASVAAVDGSTTLLDYEGWLQTASAYYARANQTLKDLRGASITKHSMVQADVFCTEYENGAVIYVNYTEKDVTVSGLTVKAKDFLRVN